MRENEEEEMPDAGEEKDACSRRPDGAAINSLKKMLYSLQFTRTTDKRAGFRKASKGACRSAIRKRDRRVDGGGQEHGARMVSEVANLGRRHQCVGTQEATARTSGGTSSPSIH